ncbi:PREDICTED: uncharacterized protein DDB_G0271670-like, partial [Dufourea novaeangliae]|uniref:uncharacterized protein DDB_G0271670-like n=1 Tax=Dufourea novaeangliae TaxID=178035 RepID=UPI000766F793
MSKARRAVHSSEDASSSSGTSSSLSSDEEVDMRDLKPIKEYLSDRRELARQLFKSVKTEKIQMMLPQVLRKIDMGHLEEWCANELSGMSKARILSILNGKAMVESSDTTDSDDSGPSLTIISDTEEWFTDEDLIKKEESSESLKGKVTKDRLKQKGKSQTQKKNDHKSSHKRIPDNVSKSIQIKKEEEVEKNKEKEGDSLLDLLELEMRARAIRALIRKEEDIIPNSAKSAEGNSTENTSNKSDHDEQKEKENCRRQLERIIGAQQSSNVEDEDVVLVVQPTPTIELLSSESEGEAHSGIRVNKKFQNERVVQTKEKVGHIKNVEANNTHNVNSTDNSKESEVTNNVSETHKNEVSKLVHSNNLTNSDTQSESGEKKKKIKKKSHSKVQQKSASSKTEIHKVKTENRHKRSVKHDDSINENIKLNGNECNYRNKSKIPYKSVSENKNSVDTLSTLKKSNVDEEKSSDLDEIIDLDNYCDDMDDIVNSEHDQNKGKKVTKSEKGKSETETSSAQKSNGAETWASRYYQTDDVQNVIKESKIQSEIRKRLRERQRLSKLTASPNKISPLSSPVPETVNKQIPEKDPLGSVDEYLALKQTAAACLSMGTSSSNSSSSSSSSSTSSS